MTTPLREEHAQLKGMLAELNASFFPSPAAVKAAVAQTERILSMLIDQVEGKANGQS